MSDHLDNAFRAATHALRDVVAPAVDGSNPLAREQLQLVIAWLEFQRQRLPYLHDRDRFELSAHAEMAEAVLAALKGSGSAGADVESLSEATDDALAALADPAAGGGVLAQTTARLQDEISAAARRAPDMPADAGRAVERSIVLHTKRILDAQRVWFLPQSVEPQPEAMSSLHDALGLSRRTANPTTTEQKRT